MKLRYSSAKVGLRRRICFGLCLWGATGCYTERVQPATFRYACVDDTDCTDDERCVAGQCETPCRVLTSAVDCAGNTLSVCVNGVCTNACQLERNHCPGRHACTVAPPPLARLLQIGAAAVCMTPCSETGCPEGETCMGEACLPTCEQASDCGTGFVCLENLCASASVTTPPRCQDNRDCLDGYGCLEGLCVPNGSATSGGSSS